MIEENNLQQVFHIFFFHKSKKKKKATGMTNQKGFSQEAKTETDTQ